MEVTEVRIKLMGDRDEKLQAFCTITFDDCFVVRDLKVIRGTKGVFVAMPSRKLSDQCRACRGKNHLRAHYCNECGAPLGPDRAEQDESGRAKLHADIAHPIRSKFRDKLQRLVLNAYEKELDRSQQPGYQPPADWLAEALDEGAAPPGDHEDERGGEGPPEDSGREQHSFGEGIFP